MSNLLEKSFLGSKMIIDEHLSPKLINNQEVIKTININLEVDTDREIYLDLEKDLHYDRELCYIQNVEGYTNISRKFLRRFDPGVTRLKFSITGAFDKFPEIFKPKKNGLGIKLSFTEI